MHSSKDPLHGVTLEALLNALVARYGWAEMARQVNINCFKSDPSIKSSLKFLRRTPWARKEVEAMYLASLDDDAPAEKPDPWANWQKKKPLPQDNIMQSWSSKDFTADRAWGALDIANFSGTTVRLHWTDQPYIWHINDGQEVFAVMDGQVAMHVKVDGEEQVIMLNAGDIFYAEVGCEHVAHPQGAARILVIEKEGSV